MALQYSLVFILLVIEMILFAVISLPLPTSIRRPLLNSLNIPFHSQHFLIFFRCMLGFITILFVDSLNRMNRVTNELYNLENGGLIPPYGVPGSSVGGASRTEIQSRRFYAQRNVYLCGLTLFLSLIVKRTADLVFELLAVKEEIVKREKDGKIDKLNSVDDKKVEQLQAKIDENNEEIANLKKQAEALSKEYNEL
ncbi:DEKNAAC100986 [Brettanomyces naardenensis]|uniref:Endoplasmic reticulum transmembrane protein n=1 Tax=Brettanomyces naardenensis TaxID=13370 RepID=A0A448YH10_BRENA|nr:DEKNAAC100986 [Brettanomyces naardenensis]